MSEDRLPGYSFPKEGKDRDGQGGPRTNRLMENPGPGQYNPELSRKTNAKTFHSGTNDNGKNKADNGFPGPGTYPSEKEGMPRDPTVNNPAPKWTFAANIKKKESNTVPGAGTYFEEEPKTLTKGIKIGTQDKSGKGCAVEDENNKITKKLKSAQRKRLEQKKIDLGVPGAGEYRIPGDFDFPDPLNPNQDKVGTKKAKFCFGMNTKTRPKNLDMPGPGEYEVDQYPMNQANIAYWIGTDVRRDLSVP